MVRNGFSAPFIKLIEMVYRSGSGNGGRHLLNQNGKIANTQIRLNGEISNGVLVLLLVFLSVG